MAKLTKADAARHLGIARSTLYKWIAQGTISATPDGMIDQAELVRVAAPVDTFEKRRRTSADTPETPTQREAETPRGGPQPAVDAQPWTGTRQPPQPSPDVVVDILRDQVQTLRDALQEARQSAQAA